MAAHVISRSALTGILFPAAPAPRPRTWSGTPEIYFDKAIDNSRLVKVADRKRNREMATFSATLCILFALVMVYAWQHFSALEYGYKIEQLQSQRDTMTESNRALRLEQASLSDPGRIDALARRMGLSSPIPGQVQRLEGVTSDPGTPVMAMARAQGAEIAVVSAGQ
jgi:cell division protein FtsL